MKAPRERANARGAAASDGAGGLASLDRPESLAAVEHDAASAGAGDVGRRRLRWSSGRGALSALPPLALLVAIVGAWELYVDLGGVSTAVLAAPHEVASEGWQHANLLWQNTVVTLEEVGLGLGLGVLAGFLLAVAIHLFGAVRRSVYPLAVGSQALPIAALAPMLAFWFGFGLLPKLFVIALICFFPVTVATVDGLAAVDADQLKLLRTLDASRAQALRFVELPTALPRVLTGARIALVVAWIAAFIAETTTPTVGPYAGLGREITTDFNTLDGARADAATAVLFLCAVLCFYTLALAERRAAAWARTRPGGQT
ncbi:MAG: ABC transporter permease [Solirubrobacteraceae bacterium]